MMSYLLAIVRDLLAHGCTDRVLTPKRRGDVRP